MLLLTISAGSLLNNISNLHISAPNSGLSLLCDKISGLVNRTRPEWIPTVSGTVIFLNHQAFMIHALMMKDVDKFRTVTNPSHPRTVDSLCGLECSYSSWRLHISYHRIWLLRHILHLLSKCWRMVSSGKLRRVALVRTDVSEKLSSSFIRVTRISELGTTLAVTSNRRTLRRNTKCEEWRLLSCYAVWLL
jgi:hypothetical protein